MLENYIKPSLWTKARCAHGLVPLWILQQCSSLMRRTHGMRRHRHLNCTFPNSGLTVDTRGWLFQIGQICWLIFRFYLKNEGEKKKQCSFGYLLKCWLRITRRCSLFVDGFAISSAFWNRPTSSISFQSDDWLGQRARPYLEKVISYWHSVFRGHYPIALWQHSHNTGCVISSFKMTTDSLMAKKKLRHWTCQQIE